MNQLQNSKGKKKVINRWGIGKQLILPGTLNLEQLLQLIIKFSSEIPGSQGKDSKGLIF